MNERSARSEMPGRLLRLLSLLQSRREWSGEELAARLGVTDRTMRRDIERLRELDYPVKSAAGTGGGYRLTAGANLPPLLLDDDEAIAMATALATTANGGVTGIEENAARALVKLERLLPVRLRPRLTAIAESTTVVPHNYLAPPVEPTVLAVLASSCRNREILSFDYLSRTGANTPRRVEPYALVTVRGHWYLLAYDPGRCDWRTFRVDRISEPGRTGRCFAPRELPAPDAAAYLVHSFATAEYRHTARVTVRLPAEELLVRLYPPRFGEVEVAKPEQCTIRLSAESAELVVQYIAAIAAVGAEFTVDAPEELRRQLHVLGQRLGAS